MDWFLICEPINMWMCPVCGVACTRIHYRCFIIDFNFKRQPARRESEIKRKKRNVKIPFDEINQLLRQNKFIFTCVLRFILNDFSLPRANSMRPERIVMAKFTHVVHVAAIKRNEKKNLMNEQATIKKHWRIILPYKYGDNDIIWLFWPRPFHADDRERE